MIGPRPQGFWMRPAFRTQYGMLQPGMRYRVVAPFLDFDRDPHTAGESWTFLGYNFLPYEDGLSLFVSADNGSEWHIRMQLSDEVQGKVVENFERYLQPVP